MVHSLSYCITHIVNSQSEADIKIKKHEQKAEFDTSEEQEAMKKAELNRFCAIGELVVKHFPGLNSLDPGKTKAEKTRNFQPLGAFLKVLASKPELVREIAEMVQFKELLEKTESGIINM